MPYGGAFMWRSSRVETPANCDGQSASTRNRSVDLNAGGATTARGRRCGGIGRGWSPAHGGEHKLGCLPLETRRLARPSLTAFDQELFGEAVHHRGFDIRESVGVSLLPNGLLAADAAVPFAGVMAFVGMSMVGASDPVLYLNPYQRWKLPEALRGHERRVLHGASKPTRCRPGPTTAT